MSFTIVSAKRTLTGTSLEAELEWRVAQLRKSGAGRGSIVEVVGTIEEDTVLRILAAHRMDARSLLIHPKWTLAETEASLKAAGHLDSKVATTSADRCDFILFTSGTEGRPKPVQLSAAAMTRHAKASAKRLSLTGSDRWLLTLSPAHVGGLAILTRAQTLGATLVLAGQRLPANLTSVVERHAVTHLSLVPTQLSAWMDAAKDVPPKGLRLILLGGAPCPPDLERRAKDAGWPVRTTYGLTEAGSQVTTQTSDSPLGSVGPPLDGIEVRVEPERGDVGRIRVRGPTLMLGYLGVPNPISRDGWFTTPDLGRLDATGNLWVLGRRDDVIVSGGENIDPAEIEAVLETHPGVKEACVVGLDDPKWGQAVVALVVPKEARPDVAALQDFLKGRLAAFKVPKRFEFWDELPRTPGGKLQRARARARLVPSTVPM